MFVNILYLANNWTGQLTDAKLGDPRDDRNPKRLAVRTRPCAAHLHYCAPWDTNA